MPENEETPVFDEPGSSFVAHRMQYQQALQVF
jgi:hypothetical protein